MNKVETRPAEKEDIPVIKDLLKTCKLPFEDIDIFINDFIVAKHYGKIIGTVGLEIYGNTALLRSFAVESEQRSKGTGAVLYKNFLDYARHKEVSYIYLLTTTAEKYFAKRGFSIIDRNDVPEEIKATTEYSSICPASAVCMFMKIDR